MAAESAGIPSVTLVCEGFERQAAATARGHGYDGLPLGVLVGHVDAQSADEMLKNLIDNTLSQIIEGLTSARIQEGEQSTEPAALDVAASGTIDEINQLFVELSLIHISEPTRQEAISYAVFCLKKKKQ